LSRQGDHAGRQRRREEGIEHNHQGNTRSSDQRVPGQGEGREPLRQNKREMLASKAGNGLAATPAFNACMQRTDNNRLRTEQSRCGIVQCRAGHCSRRKQHSLPLPQLTLTPAAYPSTSAVTLSERGLGWRVGGAPAEWRREDVQQATVNRREELNNHGSQHITLLALAWEDHAKRPKCYPVPKGWKHAAAPKDLTAGRHGATVCGDERKMNLGTGYLVARSFL